MKKINISIALIALTAIVMSSCTPKEPSVEQLFATDYKQFLQPGDSLYHLNDFLATFMTERGNLFDGDQTYRTRSLKIIDGDSLYLFSVDTLPSTGPGIFIKGRICTDDYGGNFYKTLVIQEEVEGRQQALRISVDKGSASGLYQLGQEILVRCNGLAVGRYANQPQLCVPSYDNKIYANLAEQKVGWTPGRIPGARFDEACHLIGLPNPGLLRYELITCEEIMNYDDVKLNLEYTDQKAVILRARLYDGLLVKMKDMHCTNEYSSSREPYIGGTCNTYVAGSDSAGLPEKDPYADVFAPTTENRNYPQGRLFAAPNDTKPVFNQRRVMCVSTSEYAKFAHYKLPDSTFVGTITGILGFYYDRADQEAHAIKWAISLRNLYTGDNFSNIDDIVLYNEKGLKWVPQEWTKYIDVTEEESDVEEPTANE